MAGCILGRVGNAEQKAAVRKLLQDPDARVQLRSAQGLLAGGDKTVLPTLIGLLNEPALEICWQAEELLRWAASDAAPAEVCGKAGQVERQRCHAAWKRWWAANGETLELPRLDRDPRRPGLVLLWSESEEGIYHCESCGLPAQTASAVFKSLSWSQTKLADCVSQESRLFCYLAVGCSQARFARQGLDHKARRSPAAN